MSLKVPYELRQEGARKKSQPGKGVECRGPQRWLVQLERGVGGKVGPAVPMTSER